MKALYDRFGTNPDREKEGAWIYYDDELAFKVKRISGRNKKFMLATEKIEKQKRRGTIPKAEETKKLAEMFVDCSLVDWKGVTDEDDNEIVFSRGEAVVLLTNPRWPDFMDDLFLKAQDNQYFKDLDIESKN